MIALVISNKEARDVMKLVKCHEKSGLLIKVVRETIKMKPKSKKISANGIEYSSCKCAKKYVNKTRSNESW